MASVSPEVCKTINYVPLCVGGSKGKAGIQMWCISEKRDTNNFYPGKWCHSSYRHNKITIGCGCHSLYRHNKITIGCGFEFVNNIESITLNLVTKCFLTREPLLIMGLSLLMILSL